MALPEESLQELLALAGVPLRFEDPSEAHETICRIAARAVNDADGASMTMFSRTGPEAVASSDEWAKQLDEYVEREGPCIDAGRIAGHEPPVVPELVGVTRRGVRTSFRVQLSPLRGTTGDVEGAIILIEDRGPAD